MIINGKEENIATPITVAELIEGKGLRADRVAVELNGEIVPRTQRAQTQLKGTDTLEIVNVRAGRLNHFQSFLRLRPAQYTRNNRKNIQNTTNPAKTTHERKTRIREQP